MKLVRNEKFDLTNILVFAFIISLFVPIMIFVGDVRLSLYRILLLLTVIPTTVAFFTDNLIKKRLSDYFMLLFATVGMGSLAQNGSSISASGVFFLESFGPYVVARYCIRSVEDFKRSTRILVNATILTIPFALYENYTRDPIVLTLLSKVFSVIQNVPHETRLGMDRAQVVFDHPILYGLFCSMAFSGALYATRARARRKNLLKGGLVGLAAFLSLSSGAIVCVALQLAFTVFDTLFRSIRRRWLYFVWGFSAIYTVLELASNRALHQILIPYLALNPGTGWTRLNVNEWAIGVILDNPWFGMGFRSDFPPPPWWVPTTSIDNFWLAITFRHGIPTSTFLVMAVTLIVVSVARTRNHDSEFNKCRMPFEFTLIAVCIAALTVHFWNATYCLFIFFLGSGVWMIKKEERAETPNEEEKEERHIRYNRQEVHTRYRR